MFRREKSRKKMKKQNLYKMMNTRYASWIITEECLNEFSRSLSCNAIALRRTIYTYTPDTRYTFDNTDETPYDATRRDVPFTALQSQPLMHPTGCDRAKRDSRALPVRNFSLVTQWEASRYKCKRESAHSCLE